MLRFNCEHDQRRQGRLKCRMLRCSLGDVIDLSPAGMRVHRRGLRLVKPNETIHVTLYHPVEGDLRLKSRIAWVNKTGFWRQQIGLDFLDLSLELQAALSHIVNLTARHQLGLTGS